MVSDTRVISKGSTIADAKDWVGDASAAWVRTEGYNKVGITTDGDIQTVSYRFVFLDGHVSAEIEASHIQSFGGNVRGIQIVNDTAESGKSIFVHRFLLPNTLASQIQFLPAVGSVVTRSRAFYASKEEFASSASNFFETDQPLGTTPTLNMTGAPATAQFVRIDTIKYQLTPANAVTYQLYLLEDDQAVDENSEADVFYDSGAARASGTIYIETGGASAKLPVIVNLRDVGTIWYLIDWSAASGDTTGYIRVYGEVLF